MTVDDIIPLQPERYIADDIRMIMADYVCAMQDDNDTMAALRRYFTGQSMQTAIDAMPFRSAKKYGGVSFHEDETYLLGAPEILLANCPEKEQYLPLAEEWSAKGCRVLLLGMYDGALTDETLSAGFLPIALILLSNKIRAEAPETFGYFASQGVAVKVISGDNARTVYEVAKRAGIENADRFVDARTLTTEEAIRDAAGKYTVFGRVTPAQKRSLVQALKADGHTVAMTGDGVNDVLALKEADCSVAMASGSDAAKNVSSLVLLDSNFSSMPRVVAEGRRSINNLERSAALYIMKTIYNTLLALLFMIVVDPLPFTPQNLTIMGAVTIGMPSVVLALEPNADRVTGRFLPKVLSNAVPGGITVLLGAIAVIICNRFFLTDITDAQSQTVFIWIITFVGFLLLFKVSLPTKLSSWSAFFGISDFMNEKAKEEAKAQKIDSSLYDGCVDDSEKGYSIANGVVMKVVETKDVKVKKEKKPRKKHKVNKSNLLIALNLFMYLLMIFIFVGVYFISINATIKGEQVDVIQFLRTFFRLDNHITWAMGKAMLAIGAILTFSYIGLVAIMNQIKLEHGDAIEKKFERLDAKMRVKAPKIK